MARCKIEKVKVNVAALFSFLCVVAAPFLFTIGGIFYAKENSKISDYTETTCLVSNSFSKCYENTQYSVKYAHHVSAWTVHHSGLTVTVEGTKLYKTSSKAITEANKYKVDSSYSCWYNKRKPTETQWDKPSTRRAIILLSLGGLSILLTIVFLFLTYLFIRQNNHQNEQNNVTHIHLSFLK